MFQRILNGALLLLVFVLPIKFGGNVILPQSPENSYDWWLTSWPATYAIGCAVLLAVLRALVVGREWRAPKTWWAWLPLVWVVAQWVAALASPWPLRSWLVASFFTVCAVFFYAGFCPREGDGRFRQLLAALAAATVVVCGVALQQHFIGFEQMLRDAERFAKELPPDLQAKLPDIIGKLRQGRVFGTLFYPNSLAGYLILVGPPVVCWFWMYLQQRLVGQTLLSGRGSQPQDRPDRSVWPTRVAAIAAFLFAVVMLWCLLLTKSKGGFVMLGLALAAGLMLCPMVKLRWRLGVLAALVAVGAAFYGTSGVQRGLETLEARTDYWRAGVAMVREQPWLGSGPGTFGLRYLKLRPEGAEWTRLAHNNFLQQWTDSGVVGFVSFALIWIAALWRGARRLRRDAEEQGSRGAEERRSNISPLHPCPPAPLLLLSTWVGLAAWTGHNLVDFDLYIAAIAWPAFLMAGWMLHESAQGASGNCS